MTREKPVVGQELYALVPPSHHANEEVRKVTVSKVGSRYFRVSYDAKGQIYDMGASYSNKTWEPIRGTIITTRPSLLFESEAEVNAHRLRHVHFKALVKFFTHPAQSLAGLSPTKVDQIHALVFATEDDDDD